jgi:hypothetical protein
MLFQWSLPATAETDTELQEIRNDRPVLDQFLSWIYERTTHIRNAEVAIYGFNLSYEFAEIFGQVPEELRNVGQFIITDDFAGLTEYEITVYADKRYYMKIKNLRTHRIVTVYDAFSFYHMKLSEAVAIIGETKLDADRSRFTRRDLDDPQFIAYAKRDAYITRRLGEHIIGLHEAYDLRTTISAPHFAASMFRHHYLNSVIPMPDEDLEQYGLWAYHGGRNGYYQPDPAELDNAYNVDIRSAYCEAMYQLPDIELATWRHTDTYEPGVHAVWHVTIDSDPCEYGGQLMTNGGKLVGPGRHEVYTTSYELDMALRRGEVTLVSCNGYVMEGPPGGAFVRYVDEWYERKRTAKTPADRATAKLLLLSLYGKTFQKVPLGRVGVWDVETVTMIETDPDEPYDYRAGGLYHPPIAALITGFVRARIHGMEHAYGSLMTSTDGLFARVAPPADALGDTLGSLESVPGHLRIWRERLYVFDPHDKSKRKTALHGWRGSVDQLLAVPLARGEYQYKATQMVTLRLSTRLLGGTTEAPGQYYRPGTFAVLPYTLKIA